MEEGAIKFPDKNGLNQRVRDDAYAYDLLSIQATWESLQRKADIVSGFCILFDIDIAVAKLRAFRVRWGNPNRSGPEHITVHGRGWAPSVVPLRLG